MNSTHILLTVLSLLFLTGPPVEAQKKKKSNNQPQEIDTTMYSGLKWRNIGPYRGGRTVAVAGIVDQPLIYYMGTTGGGMWKTTDAGNTWNNISDDDFMSGSVGSLASQCASNYLRRQ